MPHEFEQVQVESRSTAQRGFGDEWLAAPELTFRMLIEGIPTMTYVQAVVASPEEGNPVLYVSPQLADFWGVTTDEILDSPWWWSQRLHPEDRDQVLAADNETTRTGAAFCVDYRIVRGDGAVRWIHDEAVLVRNETGRPLFWLGVVHDNNDSKLGEERLRAGSERLGAILDASPLAIMTWDRRGRVLSWNRAAEEIFGWTADEAIGQFLPQVQDDARAEMLEYIERGFLGETWANVHLPRQRKDGSLIDCSISSAAIRDANGEVVAMLSILDDVSERRHLEEELARSQKMEAIGRLAGGIAHDFNNMLTAIKGYASLGLEADGVSDEVRGFLDEILRAASSSADLTRQLLTFTRRQVSQPAVLDLNQIVRGSEGMIARLIGEDVDIRVELGAGVGHVSADPSQIDQVLVNLAVNARAAMPGGGSLTIQTAVGSAEQTARLPGVAGSVVLRVADTGVGMDEETRAHVFEPFYTTRSEGTGLGLATVYAIVQQCGGHIRVESQPGLGSTFTIALPAIAGPQRGSTGATAPDVAAGRETILLVEDQDAVRNVARVVLEGRGYRVLEAATPSAALELVDDAVADLDLVLTDVVLPQMNGRELVDAIRSRLPGIDALYMSGYAADAIPHDGVLDVDMPLLVKPFTPDELVRKVRSRLDGKPVAETSVRHG